MRLLIALLVFISFLVSPALSEENVICVSDSDVVDLITLLDSSERDLAILEECQKLVKDLYTELDSRDGKVEVLTKELIKTKQDSLKYRSSATRWRTIAIATTTTSVVLILIQILPVL